MVEIIFYFVFIEVLMADDHGYLNHLYFTLKSNSGVENRSMSKYFKQLMHFFKSREQRTQTFQALLAISVMVTRWWLDQIEFFVHYMSRNQNQYRWPRQKNL